MKMMAPNQIAPTGDEPQRPRRVRMSKPKVKTGCNNCKQRRIKCDEQRPECSQCVRSKRRCTGYPPPPRSRFTEDRMLAPKPSGLAPAIASASTASTSSSSSASVTGPLRPRRPQARQPPQVRPRERSALPLPSPSQRELTPPESPIESLTLYRPPSSSFDPQEGQYFQLFGKRTAGELSGFFDSSFWTRSVLQECHTKEAIRHSVVALGALYKTLEKISESPPGSPSDSLDPADNARRHREIAFKHYGSAIGATLKLTSPDQETQRTSLMATVLLACFDSFIGHHQQAIVQIQNGLRLLERLREDRRRSFLPKPEEPVEQDLIQMFTRLAIQAKSYDMAFHFPQPYVIRLTAERSEHDASPSSDGSSPAATSHTQIPEVFDSLLEARTAWDDLTEQMMRFAEKLFTFTSTNGPMGILPNSFRQYDMGFSKQIEAWSTAFKPILASRMAPAKSSQEKTAISVLKMNQIMGAMLFYMTFSDSEMQFDAHLPRFKEIVELAVEVIGDEERRAAERRCPNPHFCPHRPAHPDLFGGQYTARHIKPSFSADLGIVPPLFVVATKCRDRVLRRQAIQLLRSSSRREGMWDSELAAGIGMWITTVEEQDDVVDDAVRPTSSSTEASRFSIGSPGSHGSPFFGDDIPLGPGGNARWGSRRESTPISPYDRAERSVIPESKRVMVRRVLFDLRKRCATIECGTRGLPPGMPDFRNRTQTISW
ncbi:hypothetical protein F4778DRAFT_133911 [Xylariomycetidae sp. FL2044]|nr:hypothetical protein F4778DRAFT_133911 [Xylariomycetidae sp. FL2044]